MKRIFILLFCAAAGFTSCKNFLNVVPSDARFLNDISDVSRTLASYLNNYMRNTSVSGIDAAAPWIMNQYGSSTLGSYGNIWAFLYTTVEEPEKRILDRAVENMGNWAGHYAIIGQMTLVLTTAETATGSEEVRNYVRGEALVHRAYSLFKLLQYYAPMDDASLGVPMMLDIFADYREADLQRKPQSEVYGQIIGDLLEAERLLGITPPRSTYNIAYNYDYVYRLLAQVYLWKSCSEAAEDGDWAQTAKYADLAINDVNAAEGSLPFTLADLKAKCHTVNINFIASPPAIYPEALHYFYTSRVLVIPQTSSRQYSLDVWRDLYEENDLRKRSWFTTSSLPTDQILQSQLLPQSNKFSTAGLNGLTNIAFTAFRISETYLIWIEALAHTDFAKAKEVLLLWQSVRYNPAHADPWFVPANAQELIDWIYLERKREFVLEGDIIWLDMKRFRVTDTRGAAGFDFTLRSDDFRYQFRIPDSETEKNTTIIRNPGWESLVY